MKGWVGWWSDGEGVGGWGGGVIVKGWVGWWSDCEGVGGVVE